MTANKLRKKHHKTGKEENANSYLKDKWEGIKHTTQKSYCQEEERWILMLPCLSWAAGSQARIILFLSFPFQSCHMYVSFLLTTFMSKVQVTIPHSQKTRWVGRICFKVQNFSDFRKIVLLTKVYILYLRNTLWAF